MHAIERDEYAETHRRAGPRLIVWLCWVLATGVGVYAARVAAQGLDQAEQFSGLLYFVYALARGALLGAIIGAAQGLILLFYVKKVAWAQWTLATAIGWAAHAMVLLLISDGPVNLFGYLGAQGFAAAAGLTGIALGVAVGLPQSYVLKNYDYDDNAVLWTLISAVAALVGRAVIGLGLGAGLIEDVVAMTVVETTVVAAITGFVLIDMLRRSKQQREATTSTQTIVEPTPTAVHRLGETVEIALGLSLTLHHAEVTANSIVWSGVAANRTDGNLKLPITSDTVSVSDSTQKPYSISNVTTSSNNIPANGNAEIEITATILSYSPIPPNAVYLDLIYKLGSADALVFRHYGL